MIPHLDWHGVLSGQPLQWIISGFLTTVWVSVAGMILATVLAILLLALRLGGGRPGRWLVAAWVSLFRNTPLLVQLLFWYFAAWNLLPLGARDFINDDHSWSILPGNVWWLTPEFLCSMWGLGVFTSAFLIEEIASGLRAVSHGQREAALSQGFTLAGTAPHSAAAGAGKRTAADYRPVSESDEALFAGERHRLRRTHLPGTANRELQRACAGGVCRRHRAVSGAWGGDGRGADASRPGKKSAKESRV